MRRVSLEEVISEAQESRLADVWTSGPGVVLSYDTAGRVATVRPLFQRPIEGPDGATIHETIPDLPSVPVLFPRAGASMITFPVPAETTGLLLFLTLSAGAWRRGPDDGKRALPSGDQRRHHLGSAVFLPGFTPDAKGWPAAEENALVIEAAEVRLGDHTATQFVALANLVKARLDTIQAAFDAHTHGGVTAGGAASGPPAAVIGALAAVAATQVKAI